ncbi:MAG: zinc ribbon domain-containing protein [Lachnospiraceae bacterium]|nr:zinc ribbon domain-containing protein [Lachnospiraceae bacterium]
MFCPNCGNQLPDGSAFCDSCGTQLGGSQQPQMQAPQGGYAQQTQGGFVQQPASQQAQGGFFGQFAGGAAASVNSGMPSSIYAWIMGLSMIVMMLVEVFELKVLHHDDPLILHLTDNMFGMFLYILIPAVLIVLDYRECKKSGKNLNLIFCVVMICMGGFFPLYLFVRALKVDKKFGYFIFSLIPYVLLTVLIMYAYVKAHGI